MNKEDIDKLNETLEMQNLINIVSGQTIVRNLDQDTLTQAIEAIRVYTKTVSEKRLKDKEMQSMLEETREEYREFDQNRSL